MSDRASIKHKSLPLQCKLLGDGDDVGQFEAFVSVYGVKDSYGDVMEFGCAAKSIAVGNPICVYFHNWEQPIGQTLEIRELPPGDPQLPDNLKSYGALYVKCQLLLKIQKAAEAYELLKSGVVREFSIGYFELAARDEPGGRYVSEIDLVEYSPVLRGANPLTQPISVKAPGASFADHSEQVLGNLQEFTKRATKIHQLRAEEGAKLSASRVADLREVYRELGELLDLLDAPPAEEVLRAKAKAALAL